MGLPYVAALLHRGTGGVEAGIKAGGGGGDNGRAEQRCVRRSGLDYGTANARNLTLTLAQVTHGILDSQRKKSSGCQSVA